MDCATDKNTELHSVVFKTDAPNRWTAKLARKWLKDHGIVRLKTLDKTKNSLRYRIVDPECFVSFTTKVVEGDMGTINLVIGRYAKDARVGGRARTNFKLKKKPIKKTGQVTPRRTNASPAFRKTVKARKTTFLNRKKLPVGGALHL